MTTALDSLILSLRSAVRYNADAEAPPACVLWTDGDGQWEAALPLLRARMPELHALGAYAPDERRGPAIWLRCAIAEAPGAGATPILYLPGVSRPQLRAVEQCPPEYKPLAELQYRGVFWTQGNTRDWTLTAFLNSKDGGLGLDAATDDAARAAMARALPHWLRTELDELRDRRLDADAFNLLLAGGDPVRALLNWIGEGDDWRAARGLEQWRAFVDLCKSRYAFDPEKHGLLGAAERLAKRAGPWRAVWERFGEGPQHFRSVRERLAQSPPPKFDLFADAAVAGAWPQWNAAQEDELRSALAALADAPAHDARRSVRELEARHAERRTLPWAQLGEAPLAGALLHLAALADATARPLPAAGWDEVRTAYAAEGWRADDAALRAFAAVQAGPDVAAVAAAVRALYEPWLDDGARRLQALAAQSSYPRRLGDVFPELPPGACVLFVDGLRLDIGRRLADALQARGCAVETHARWAALPSVTATGKPAASPVSGEIVGADDCDDFEPCAADTGRPLNGSYHLHRLLREAGWQLLDDPRAGEVRGRAWIEVGDVDAAGHAFGAKLAGAVGQIVDDVAEKISALLAAGWRSVRVVTDHGWLWLPGGLRRQELPGAAMVHKWGRCAAAKDGAAVSARAYGWYWNPAVQFLLPDGAAAFLPGQEYAHGGLSAQECVIPELVVTRTGARQLALVQIGDVVWRQLRCTVVVEGIEGDSGGLQLDVRRAPADAASSLVVARKPFDAGGKASVVVEDDRALGQAAWVVVLDAAGDVAAQGETKVGGGEYF